MASRLDDNYQSIRSRGDLVRGTNFGDLVLLRAGQRCSTIRREIRQRTYVGLLDVALLEKRVTLDEIGCSRGPSCARSLASKRCPPRGD